MALKEGREGEEVEERVRGRKADWHTLTSARPFPKCLQRLGTGPGQKFQTWNSIQISLKGDRYCLGFGQCHSDSALAGM